MSGGGMKSVASSEPGRLDGGAGATNSEYYQKDQRCGTFQMPLHYPRYNRAEYEAMPEWKLDCLLKEYGLPIVGDVQQKKKFAIGAFLWPH